MAAAVTFQPPTTAAAPPLLTVKDHRHPPFTPCSFFPLASGGEGGEEEKGIFSHVRPSVLTRAPHKGRREGGGAPTAIAPLHKRKRRRCNSSLPSLSE